MVPNHHAFYKIDRSRRSNKRYLKTPNVRYHCFVVFWRNLKKKKNSGSVYSVTAWSARERNVRTACEITRVLANRDKLRTLHQSSVHHRSTFTSSSFPCVGAHAIIVIIIIRRLLCTIAPRIVRASNVFRVIAASVIIASIAFGSPSASSSSARSRCSCCLTVAPRTARKYIFFQNDYILNT